MGAAGYIGWRDKLGQGLQDCSQSDLGTQDDQHGGENIDEPDHNTKITDHRSPIILHTNCTSTKPTSNPSYTPPPPHPQHQTSPPP